MRFGEKGVILCPRCTGPTTERSVLDPMPNDSPFAQRKKYWWDCAACPASWENCGICMHGALVPGTLWGEPDVLTITCKGGCGFRCASRPRLRAQGLPPPACLRFPHNVIDCMRGSRPPARRLPPLRGEGHRL